MKQFSIKKIILLLFITLAFVSCNSTTTKKENTNNSQEDQITLLTEKISKNGNDAELYNSRAKLYLAANKTNDALADISKAIQIDEKKYGYFITLSDVYLAMNKVEKCQDALAKALSLSPQSAETYVKFAELNLYLKKYEETHKYADKAIEIQELSPKAFFIKGFAYKEAGDSSKAVRNFMKTIEIEPEYYDAYMQLGLMFSNRKNKNAIDYFNSALNLKPKSIEAYYALGMFQQENGNPDAAIKAYKYIIAIDPKYKQAYYNIGYVYLEYKQAYHEAIKSFTEAINADNNYAEAYYNRGYTYELMNDYDKARIDFKKAIQLKTNYTKAIEGMNRLDKK
ncbi:MAG: tetratricopeptide repeat protein [Bacteroidales bacterium]